MASRRKIPAETQDQVRERAQYLCEYCHTSEIWQYVRFTVDHIIPLEQGGTEAIDNLALACFHCNRRKSNRLAAIDPISGTTTPLFNPRMEQWAEHFIWSADMCQIIGITSIGRATVDALNFNRERIIHIRMADIEVGRHPPSDDLVQNEPG